MAKRVAFFVTKEEVEKFYNMETKKQALFEPHYNLSPGHQLPVITLSNGKSEINRIRWGQMRDKKSEETTIGKKNAPEALKNQDIKRCIITLSGFFVWKDDEEKNHPFFIRLLNNPVMSIAGLLHQRDEPFLTMITTESNALIQPMSHRMPLMLDHSTAMRWLNPDVEPESLLEKADKLYLLTDLSVLRVSKKVNDPGNNSSEIIQPIPK